MNLFSERRLVFLQASNYGGESALDLKKTDRAATSAERARVTTNQQAQRDQKSLVNDLNAANPDPSVTYSRGSSVPSRVLSDEETDAMGVPRGTKVATGSTKDNPGGSSNGVQIVERRLDPKTGEYTYSPIEGTNFTAQQRGGTPSTAQGDQGVKTSDGRIKTVRDLRLAGKDTKGNPRTDVYGQPLPSATPDQITKNALILKGIMDAGFKVTEEDKAKALELEQSIQDLNPENITPATDENGNPTETPQELDLRKKQAEELMKRKMEELQQLKTKIENPPSDGSFDPLDPAAATLQGIQTRAGNELMSTLNDIGTNLTPDDFATDRAAARQRLEDELALTDELDKVRRDREENEKERLLRENERNQALAELESNKSIMDQMEKNEEEELIARRRVNQLSGGHDLSGMKFIRKNIQDGREAVQYLQSKLSILRGQYQDRGIAITNNYLLGMKEADVTKKVEYHEAWKTYDKELSDIKKDLNLANKNKAAERLKANQRYSDILTKLDLQHGDNLNTLRIKALDQMHDLEKTKMANDRAQVSNAIKMLALMTKKGVSMDPKAIANFEQQIAPDLPTGWMSFATGGGGSGTGTSFKTWTPDGLTAAMKWVETEPGRNLKDLSPSDQQWLVPIYSGEVGGGGAPLPAGVQGPQKNPFSFETPSLTSQPSAVKEYDTIVERTGHAPIGTDGKPMSVQDWIAQRSFNPLIAPSPTASTQSQTTVQQTSDDSSVEDAIIYSDDESDYSF